VERKFGAADLSGIGRRVVVQTTIYMVRHGESLKNEGTERTRGLTDKGNGDANRVTELLKDEGIDVLVSSPYRRAIQTIEGLARHLGKEVEIVEELKELVFAGEDKVLPDTTIYPAIKEMFADSSFFLPGGESKAICEARSVAVLQRILSDCQGKKVAIGTHGMVMTLMMGYFDSRYGYDFLMQTSKPDIYKLDFEYGRYVDATRLWTS
jgi:2,3-bisphosphoglycerate-dependent phosphoglycerate mutase